MAVGKQLEDAVVEQAKYHVQGCMLLPEHGGQCETRTAVQQTEEERKEVIKKAAGGKTEVYGRFGVGGRTPDALSIRQVMALGVLREAEEVGNRINRAKLELDGIEQARAYLRLCLANDEQTLDSIRKGFKEEFGIDFPERTSDGFYASPVDLVDLPPRPDNVKAPRKAEKRPVVRRMPKTAERPATGQEDERVRVYEPVTPPTDKPEPCRPGRHKWRQDENEPTQDVCDVCGMVSDVSNADQCATESDHEVHVAPSGARYCRFCGEDMD